MDALFFVSISYPEAEKGENIRINGLTKIIFICKIDFIDKINYNDKRRFK